MGCLLVSEDRSGTNPEGGPGETIRREDHKRRGDYGNVLVAPYPITLPLCQNRDTKPGPSRYTTGLTSTTEPFRHSDGKSLDSRRSITIR